MGKKQKYIQKLINRKMKYYNISKKKKNPLPFYRVKQ